MGFTINVCYQNDSGQFCCLLLFSLHSAVVGKLRLAGRMRPREHFVRPANTFETSVNLSDDDRRENNCRIKEPKTLHATIKKAFVSLRIFRPFRE